MADSQNLKDSKQESKAFVDFSSTNKAASFTALFAENPTALLPIPTVLIISFSFRNSGVSSKR